MSNSNTGSRSRRLRTLLEIGGGVPSAPAAATTPSASTTTTTEPEQRQTQAPARRDDGVEIDVDDSMPEDNNDDDTSRHPYAHLVIPGVFVVLQGMPGDGMANTLMSSSLRSCVPTSMSTTASTTTASAPIATTPEVATTTATAAAAATTSTSTRATSTRSPRALTSSRTAPMAMPMPPASTLGLGMMPTMMMVAPSSASAPAAGTGGWNAGGGRASEEGGGVGGSASADDDHPMNDVVFDDVNDNDDDSSSSSSMVMVATTTTEVTTTASSTEGAAEDSTTIPSRPNGVDDDDDARMDEPVRSSNNRPEAATDVHHNSSATTASTIAEWEHECRRREMEQHQEFIEALALASRSTASARQGGESDSTNLLQQRLLHSTLSLPVSESVSSSSASDTSSSCWWRNRRNGQLIVFDSSLVNEQDGSIAVAAAMAASAATSNVVTLAPGTHVRATRAHTVDARTLRPVVPQGGGDNSSSTAPSSSQPHFTLSQGELGTIQLLQIESPVAGWIVLSWNGYGFLAPGTSAQYTAVDPWVWRVTCPSGAFVREGLYLGTKRVAVIPYGHLLSVDRKTVNAQGLSRLRVRYVDARTHTVIRGWCSEFLNPVSGQRGSVMQPLPFPTPAFYRVLLDEGAIVRTGVELSSPVIGCAKKGQVLCATSRCFSEHPQDRCLLRLELAGNGGYVSMRLNKPYPENLLVVERVDDNDGADQQFDPDRPGDFHLSWMRKIQAAKEESHRRANAAGNAPTVQLLPCRLPASRLSPDISSVDEGDESSEDNTVHEQPALAAATLAAGIATADDELFAGLVDMYSPTALQTSSPSNRSPRHRPDAAATASSPRNAASTSGSDDAAAPVDEGTSSSSVCLICLCEDRTATLVHGETGHICCCLVCARILKARGDGCPVCRLPIDLVVQHFWA